MRHRPYVVRNRVGSAYRNAAKPIPRQLYRIFALRRLMGNPCPIALRIAVLSGLLPGRYGMVKEHGIDRGNIKSEVGGSPNGIAGIFDGDAVSGVVLAIQESRYTENPVAVRASGIAAEGDGEQLKRLFLTLKVEILDSP